MRNNYDTIADYYNTLSRLVYGNSLIKAQTCLFKYVTPNSTILIVGGGTGRILEELAKIHTTGLVITYVEISAKMISLAKKKNPSKNQVYFVHQSVEDFISDQQYDIIVTPFLFDNFTEDKIRNIFTKLDTMLELKGKWLYADFFYDEKKGEIWQKIFLKIMYRFFRLTCDIEATTLVNMEALFKKNGYQNIFEETHYAGFIKSIAYSR